MSSIKKNNILNNKNKKKDIDINKTTRRYKQVVEPRLEEITSWARDGVTEAEMAKRLGISYSSFKNYKNINLSFLSALKKSKEHYDNQVVEALHKNTLGGIVELKVPIKIKKTFFNEHGKKEREEEEIIYATTQEYVKPDTMAQIYWLNNRQAQKWKNKPISEEKEHPEEKLNELILSLDNHVQTYVGKDNKNDGDK